MGQRKSALPGAVAAACVCLALIGPVAPAGAASGAKTKTEATIRWASHGIPHIKATSWRGLGYGYGYALASKAICLMADTYTTVRAERSRYFGPKNAWAFKGNGTTANNLNSDFFFQRIIDNHTIEKLMAQPPPNGPLPQVRQAVAGYVAGYNRWLADNINKIKDPQCAGKPWVKPIAVIDAYRRFYELALLASSAVAIDGIGSAQPPTPDLGPGTVQTDLGKFSDAARIAMLGELKDKLPLGGIGSNAIGLGKDATVNGHGMLLGNPHFPWDGSERFFQSQLTIPGKLNVAGASLMGVPVILIGHTQNLAWSHTVSTAFRFTPYELKLVPGSPTSYIYDGKVLDMHRDKVTVMVPGATGGVVPVTRTLYSTIQGPIFTSIMGLPLFPWLPVQAYAMGDANANNFRYLNHFFATDQAQSTDQLYDILKRYQGIPWVNTIAADRAGKAFYADISVTPNVPDSLTKKCTTGPIGIVAESLLGLPVLDGTTSACKWLNDPDAIQPGTFGPSHQPHLFRDDFVENSNDSYWLSNPKQPLTGFARIIGAERTARSLRMRNGDTMIQARIDGTDGLPGKKFTLKQLRDLVFNDRQYAGVLWRDKLVQMCRASPTILGSAGLVNVSAGCDAIAKWDLHDNLDSHGALLFRRFVERVLASVASGVSVINPWTTPFNADDPVNTPNGLDTNNPLVRSAFADAVSELNAAKIPLDAGLRGYQYEVRNGEKIPIHGGPGTDGDFNAINDHWTKGKGYIDVPHGSSFVETVSFPAKGCPQSYSILTYSQSPDPTSPFYSDQTHMFSNKQWNPMRFCESSLMKDPNLRIQTLKVPAR